VAQAAPKDAKEWSPGFRADVVETLAGLFDGRADVKQGKMFGLPAFSTAGKVFACAFGDGIALKLPPATIERLADPGISPFRPMGRSMGNWVHVCRPGAADYRGDEALFDASIAYVADEAPKSPPAPRKRAAKA
jgi:hypothetical protein